MNRKKVLTVVGARPNFIKCAPISRLLRRELDEVVVHTGQHYDPMVSDIFFDEFELPAPGYHLGIGSASHGVQTGKMLAALEEVIAQERPDLVLVYGDTNSTLAGALAAAKLRIPVAHVEAGPRNFDMGIPEEVNRVVTDRLSSLLLAPTQTSVRNLAAEGIVEGVHHTGDVMLDLALEHSHVVERRNHLLERLGLDPKNYYFATLHRAGNTDEASRLRSILSALAELDGEVVLPLHPRTAQRVEAHGLEASLRGGRIRPIEATGYADSLTLQKNARVVLTDSGGVQKEAFFVGTPCVTFLDSTPWVEIVEQGWNILVDAEPEHILNACRRHEQNPPRPAPDRFAAFGGGQAAVKTVKAVVAFLNGSPPRESAEGSAREGSR